MPEKSYSSKLSRPPALFMGIDLGTTGCRAMAIDASGKIKAKASYHYQTHYHKQTPQDWWQATQHVIGVIVAQVNQQHIQAIAVDGTSSTVLFCNHAGEPLTPVVMYDQQHAKPQADFLKNYAPKNSVVLNATSGLAKILWLLEHHKPEEKFHIVHQADWVAGQLCQRFDFSDINNALKTGFDPLNKIWPLWLTDLFNKLSIHPASLPTVFTPGSLITNIDIKIAQQLNLPLDVEIIAGTTDSTAAFIASNKNNKVCSGDAVTSLGSTLVLKVVSDSPINDVAHGVYSQPYGKKWLVGGASNSGGAVLKYYFNDQQMQQLSTQLKPEINTQLNYYPLLNPGERFPINDPNLAPRISPKVDNDVVFFQGLLEGIAEIEHTGYKLLQQLGAPYPTLVQTTGGGAINKAWLEIRAKILGVPVITTQHSAAAYGAAKLAAYNYLK